ncbi:Hint domain-containing protein [Leisingera daeponensis]|uniref:Hint domain-containing protein n=1 Tax=Leisingera daeponensis TaxID=405746 RepID=UPI001C9660D4|nr:Hint domain-containing protein [Leisingera daeponensis]MBY6057407.1 Hint domain-containing protein [Leisingera daeponensis]
MTIPQSLHRAAANAVEATAILQDPAALRSANKPQLRRYEVSCLLPGGGISETRHIAPALPLFENAFSAFTRGSLVETAQGPIAVEDLLPGDEILTRDGGSQPLLWIGRTSVLPGRGGSRSRGCTLTSFMADSLGLQKPSASLVAGPAARLLRTPPHMQGCGDGQLLTLASEFQDGMSIFETAPPAPVDLCHLCLPRHAVITVGGLAFETYHPGPDALKLASYAIKTLFLNLFAHADSIQGFGPLAFPRADNASQPGPAIL